MREAERRASSTLCESREAQVTAYGCTVMFEAWSSVEHTILQYLARNGS